MEETHVQSMRLQLAILGEPRLHKEAITGICNDAVRCHEIMAKCLKTCRRRQVWLLKGQRGLPA